jgi:S-formylglutathione hydrolase FrmB
MVKAIRMTLLTALLAAPNALAYGKLCGDGDRPVDLARLNTQLQGRVDDYTANHGQDRRIAAPSLEQRRALYVYVPPGYDPARRYPLILWLHGLAQDEKSFLQLISALDKEIAAGNLPRCVIAAPDGTVNGKASLKEPPSLYLNSPLGKFEDFIVLDVWNHVVTNYSIRKERQAHVLAGASMGAFGAYNLAIKHREDFGVVAGVLPPLNLRYADKWGRTDTNYNPETVSWLNEYRPNATVASFGCLGIVSVKQRQMIAPVFGEGADVIAKVAADNPAEMLESRNVKPGELEMFAGYGQKDEFNFDAQTESFAAIARTRGLAIQTVMVPNGKHDKETAAKMLPSFVEWLKPKLAPYAPKD